jgi:hypothetical protein
MASVCIHTHSRQLETGRFFVEDLKENIRTEIRRIDTAETVRKPARHHHDKESLVVAASVYIHARSRRLETGRFFVEDLKENIRTEIRRIDTTELHRV